MKTLRRIDRRLRRIVPRPAYYFLRRRYYDARTVVRHNPGRGRLLPDFIVFGTAKSGTTTYYSALAQHPFVEPCVTKSVEFENTKEVRFFDYDYYRGRDWYRSHFPLERSRGDFEATHGRPFLTGEASPTYIADPWAAGRVRSMLPDVKLIAVFRDPVERAYSQFRDGRAEGVEECESFAEAVAKEEERLRPELARIAADPMYRSWNFARWSYLRRSRYDEQIEPWLALFPREQFLFLKAEDMFADPQQALDATHEFLGLPPHRPEHIRRLNVTPGRSSLPDDVREDLVEYFRPHNERFYELTGIDFGWEREPSLVSGPAGGG
jgi:hypothetical protein